MKHALTLLALVACIPLAGCNGPLIDVTDRTIVPRNVGTWPYTEWQWKFAPSDFVSETGHTHARTWSLILEPREAFRLDNVMTAEPGAEARQLPHSIEIISHADAADSILYQSGPFVWNDISGAERLSGFGSTLFKYAPVNGAERFTPAPEGQKYPVGIRFLRIGIPARTPLELRITFDSPVTREMLPVVLLVSGTY